MKQSKKFTEHMDAKKLAALRVEDAKLYVDVQKLQRESNQAMVTDPKVLAWTQRRQKIQALFREHRDEVLVQYDEARQQVADARGSREDILLELEGCDLKIEQAEAHEMSVWSELRNLKHDTSQPPPRKPGARPNVRRGQINSFSDIPIGPS